MEAQTKPVLPQAPLARTADLSVEKRIKNNALMYLALCLIDAETEAAGAPSASTIDQVRAIIDNVAAGVTTLSQSDTQLTTSVTHIKAAIGRCVDNTYKEHGDDSGPGDHAGARARNFVARLSGSLECLGEQELADKVFSILARSDA